MGILGIVENAAVGNQAGGYGRYEPKKKHQWFIDILPISSTKLGATLLPDQLNSLRIQILQAARPNLSVNEVPLMHGNEIWYVAGKPIPSDLQVTFYDSIPNKGDDTAPVESAASILWKWFTTIYDPTSGKINYSKDYKANAILTMTDPSGDTAVEKWLYIGIWPKAIDMQQVTYGEDGPMQVTAVFRWDKVYRVSSGNNGESPDSLEGTQVEDTATTTG